MQQLRQDLRRVQNLCSSAERELRHAREKNADLQKQNLVLQQECTKVGAEESLRRAWRRFTGNGSSAALVLEQTSCPWGSLHIKLGVGSTCPFPHQDVPGDAC